MSELKCWDCPKRFECAEYNDSLSSDRAMYDLERKEEKCEDIEAIAQERYEDLCEYFGESKDILKNRDDFKAWLDRVKWHIRKAEELYENKCFDDIPSVENKGEDRLKGNWIDREVYDADRWKCSECGRTEQYKENFCPNCGADMRGE